MNTKRNPENEQEDTNHPFFLLSQTMELQEMFEGIVPEEEEVPQGENLYGNTFSIAVPAVSENSLSVHSPDIETEILMELEEMDKRIEQEVEQHFSSKLPFPLYLSKKQNLMKIFLKTQIMKTNSGSQKPSAQKQPTPAPVAAVPPPQPAN